MKIETKQVWERQKGEPNKAYNLFKEFMMLGRSRTLQQLYDILVDWYNENNQNQPNNHEKKPPTLNTLKSYSSKYNWMQRVGAYDDYIDMQRLKIHEQRDIDKEKEYVETTEPEIIKTLEKLQYDIDKSLKELEKAEDVKATSKAHALKSIATSIDIYIKNTRLIYNLSTDSQTKDIHANIKGQGAVARINYIVDKTSDAFFEKQLEYIDKMIEEHNKKAAD